MFLGFSPKILTQIIDAYPRSKCPEKKHSAEKRQKVPFFFNSMRKHPPPKALFRAKYIFSGWVFWS